MNAEIIIAVLIILIFAAWWRIETHIADNKTVKILERVFDPSAAISYQGK